MAEEKKDEAPAKDEPAGPKMILGLSLPMFGMAALNALVMIGGMSYVVYVKMIYKKPPITEPMVVAEIKKNALPKKNLLSGTVEEEKKFFTEAFPEMTVNLRTTKGGKEHFATLEVALACENEQCASALKASKAKIQDTIQAAISSRSYTELNSIEIKARLKFEIQQKVNAFLQDDPVTEVYFTDFIVQ